MDWELTEDGDLKIGKQMINQFGNPVYLRYDGDYSELDEQDSKPVRDLSIVQGETYIRQMIDNRIRTLNSEWYHHPLIGADVETHIGKKNTRETAGELKESIIHSLTYKNLLENYNFEVNIVPVTVNRLLIDISVNYETEYYRVPYLFDLADGLIKGIEDEEEEDVY